MPPPPTLKRPRQSAGTSTQASSAQAGSGSGPGASGANPRVKRRKNEADDVSVADGSEAGGRGKGGAGNGVKGKEGDAIESGEAQTKVSPRQSPTLGIHTGLKADDQIDFRELPVETLYKYLEHNDLLPRWVVSPWSEDPCVPRGYFGASLKDPCTDIPANALYTAATAPTTALGLVDENGRSPSVLHQKPDADPSLAGTPALSTEANAQPTTSTNPEITGIAGIAPSATDGNGDSNGPPNENPDEAMNGEEDLGEADHPATRTTRSKTAPQRKQATPDASPGPSDSYQRPVITLSDVHAARDALAERANAHWTKGLGGGQNKEGETIVNFLYKMKVGPGKFPFRC